jgi:hypothetical protein
LGSSTRWKKLALFVKNFSVQNLSHGLAVVLDSLLMKFHTTAKPLQIILEANCYCYEILKNINGIAVLAIRG